MIPAYPAFRPLERSDQSLFEQAFAENPPEISEYTFSNLYAWRTKYQFQVSQRDGFILLRTHQGSSAVFFPPIGKGNPKETISAVLKETGGSFARLPESLKGLFDGEAGALLDLDADNSDYLFLTDDLVHLRGKKYDGKRNLIRKFKAANAYEYAAVDNGLLKECVHFADEWCVDKGCDTVESLGNERGAFKEMLADFSSFRLRGGVVTIDRRIRAVVLGQELNPQTLVIHILKAFAGITGLYQTAFNEFLSREARGFTYVNMEQDLGVAGLRKSKLSYQPARMIRKYVLRLK